MPSEKRRNRPPPILDEPIILDAPTLPQAAQEGGGELVIHVDDFDPGDKIVVQVPSVQPNWHPSLKDTLRGYLNDTPSENVVYIDVNNQDDGSWDTYFDPSNIPDGTYVATYTKTNAVLDVVGSHPQPVTVEGSTALSYALQLSSLTPNGAQANSTAENQGRAVVTCGDAALQQAEIVKFTFDRGSATFDTTKPYVKLPDSTSTVLYVETHFDDGVKHDIADAYFTDAQAETVTLKASLPDAGEAPAKTQDFTFAANAGQRYKVKITDYNSLISDGESTNVSGTVFDTLTEKGVDGTCSVQCQWPVGGPDSAAVTKGKFSFSVYGEYSSGRLPRHGEVTVIYGDGRDKARINVQPLPP